MFKPQQIKLKIGGVSYFFYKFVHFIFGVVLHKIPKVEKNRNQIFRLYINVHSFLFKETHKEKPHQHKTQQKSLTSFFCVLSS